jgi:hypothetical protein
MDVDTAESIGGRRVSTSRGSGSLGLPQIAQRLDHQDALRLGVDMAADKARDLVPDGTDIDGPVPLGGRLNPPNTPARNSRFILAI